MCTIKTRRNAARCVLLGVLGVLVRLQIMPLSDLRLTAIARFVDEPPPALQKVFGLPLPPRESPYYHVRPGYGYKRLEPVRADERHGNGTYWLVHWMNERFHEDVLESLRVRFERRGWDYDNVSRLPNYLEDYAYRVMEEDGWKVFYNDGSDRASQSNLAKMLQDGITKIIGWKYFYLLTRSTTSNPFRRMANYGTNPARSLGAISGLGNQLFPWNATFQEDHLGDTYNFTSHLGISYAGVKHISFPVREALLLELERHFRARQQEGQNETMPREEEGMPTRKATATTTTTMGAKEDEQGHDDDPVVYSADLPRPIDAATFWAPGDTSYSASLRSEVSKAVQELQKSHNVSVITAVEGQRGKNGRRRVQEEYVNALLDTKIYVLCQRDGWEDHIRLFEALVSGAMVMSDPMRDFPTGLSDGETIVVYWGIEDMQNKVLYYLNKEEERLRIASQGRQLALSQHRMWHRYENLILGDWSFRNEYGISTID